MTEQEEYLYNEMPYDIKEEINNIIKYLNNEVENEVTLLSEIPLDVVKEYLHCEGYHVYAEYADKLTTPYSIMKYMQLYNDERYTCEKLENYLNSHFNDENYIYYIVKKFKNELLFETKTKKAQLKVLYNYNLEEDKFSFYLPGQNYNFAVSFDTIKAILSGTTLKIVSENSIEKDTNKDTHMSLIYAGVKITIEKQ